MYLQVMCLQEVRIAFLVNDIDVVSFYAKCHPYGIKGYLCRFVSGKGLDAFCGPFAGRFVGTFYK